MNKKIKNVYYGLVIVFVQVICLLASCQKDYFEDSGLQNGIYSFSSLEYLEQRPFFFDTLVTVIHLAGMDDIIEDSTVTFFVPTDHAIAKAMDVLNSVRYEKFEDSLSLKDIPMDVWRKFLSRYIFRGKFMLKDITRKDPQQLNVYPGMNMETWNGYIMNLGVRFSNYQGTKDVGPRRLTITQIGDMRSPVDITTEVATSDLQTKYGVLHILDDDHAFAFRTAEFSSVVELYINL